jgi:hypothetical protein
MYRILRGNEQAAIRLAVVGSLVAVLLIAATAIADTVTTSATSSLVSATSTTDVAATSTNIAKTNSATSTSTSTELVIQQPTLAATSTTPLTDASSSIPSADATSSSETTPVQATATTTATVMTQSPMTESSSTPLLLVAVLLKCTAAYTADLYDTPSGHLDAGYSLADSLTSTSTTIASDKTSLIAHKIGAQSWVMCSDRQGHKHEIAITAQTYADLANPDVMIPQMIVMENAAQADQDSF